MVLQRQVTYGVRSEQTARFLERAFRIYLSCRQRGKAGLQFLCDYVYAFLKGLKLACPLVFDTS